MIPALVLTAGLATRLRPLSFVRAKAALPVAGVPLVQRILSWLAIHDVDDAVLNLHHLPHTITSVVGSGGADGVRVRYSWEPVVLGSAGGPRRALPLLGSSTFLIVNGDTLTNVDVSSLVAEHRKSGAMVTMAVIPNREPEKYSGLSVDGTGAFTGVVARGSPQPSYHFVGVQVAEADAFAMLPDNRPFESVRQLYPNLVATRRGSVRIFVTDAEFFDIGTPADYLETSLLFDVRERGGASHAPHLGSGSHLDQCVVWDDVVMGDRVRLSRCIVTDGVRVPDGAAWENSTIRIGRGELTPSERRAGEMAIGPVDIENRRQR
jgi:NDP-sugar pyrophosphorylase family protein